jgi:hypothetical protein
MAENGTEMVRYADDFILLCRSRLGDGLFFQAPGGW